MSKIFTRLLVEYINKWPNVKDKDVKQHGLTRASIQWGSLSSYRTPILLIAPNLIFINNRFYSNTSKRDRYAVEEAVKTTQCFSDKMIVYMDFEMFRRIHRSPDWGDTILYLREDFKLIDLDTDERGNYLVFNFKDRYFYAYFLFNPQRKTAGKQFICELPAPAKMVGHARFLLIPKEIAGKDRVLRQGDLFFVPIRPFSDDDAWVNEAIMNIGSKKSSMLVVQKKDFSIGGHVVSEAIIVFYNAGSGRRTIDSTYVMKVVVRGYVRHAQHGRLKLGDGERWYLVYPNTALSSWGFEEDD